MTDFESRLRAAMAAAAEPAPAGLLDGIRRRHRRHVRRVGAACVAAVAAAAVAVPLAIGAVQAGPAVSGPAAPGAATPAVITPSPLPTPSPVPTSTPTAAPGTVLRDCQNNNNGTVGSAWKKYSIQAGPVWFIYARGSRSWPPSRRLAGGKLAASAFVIAITNGRRATVTDAAAAGGRFRFLAGFNSRDVYTRRAGEPGLTLVGCPAYSLGSNIPQSYAPGLTMFWQGYVNDLGRCIPLEVRTPRARQPVQVNLGATVGGKCAS